MANKSPKGKKLLLFKLLSVLFPFVLLFILEAALRVFNYGHNTDLFVKYAPDERYMRMNYYASDKYFSDTLNATKGNEELFEANKSPNTFRIFVLGESTTIRYPYFHNGAFHRWLQYRLMRMYPNINFEVINLSLTAVNSYTVLDFGRQLPQYHPDAVLIYAGHNEYYGALGIGSTSYVGSNRFLVQLLIKLKGLKLVQLFNNCIKKVTGLFTTNKINVRETLMKRMVARQYIAYNSPDYMAGINQYQQNMTELCGLLSDNHIPVFLSTVVSNEKDQPPFISNGSGAGSAAYFYKSGQQAMKKQDFAVAKEDFDKAKELDELRFRAPEAINTVIKKLTAEFPLANLVDTKKVFEQNSPNGIVGSETILEHVHPNLYGYGLMSEAFYQAIKGQHLIPGVPEKELTFAELQKEMPVTTMDSLNGAYQIMILKTGWPFYQPIPKTYKPGNSVDEKFALQVSLLQIKWNEAMKQLYEYNQNKDNKPEALKIMKALMLEYPNSKLFYNYCANLSAMLNNFDEAAFYYRKLYQLDPGDRIAQAIYQLYLRADEPNLAAGYVKNIPEGQQALAGSILAQIIKDKGVAITDTGYRKAAARIAANYKTLGAPETALKYSGK